MIEIDRAGVAFASIDGGGCYVPLREYRGVAVRMEGNGAAGRVRVFLELLHADRMLTVPLTAADDPDGVAADWQAWGRRLDLPLLVVSPDGTVSAPLANLGSLTVYAPAPRRRPAHFRARRPRFLVRRKAGRAARAAKLTGREIIARN
jgi:hypothetical protein